MKLPAATLTTQEKLDEFDVWVTPYLGDIRETPQFKSTRDAIVRAFDRLCEATKDFASEAELDHGRLADNLVALFTGRSRKFTRGTSPGSPATASPSTTLEWAPDDPS